MTQTPPQTGASPSPCSGELRGGLIGALDVPVLAPLIAPILERSVALCGGRVDTYDLLQLAAERKAQIWLVVEEPGAEIHAVIVTQVFEYTRKKVLEIIQCAGDGLHRWKHMIDQIEAWAKEEGCTAIEIRGRRGWGRLFPDYQPLYTVFSKEVA